MLDQLRADFRAADRADGHDQAETQIDVSERAMTFRRDDRFADDVREIGADREIPMQPDRAQRRTGDETAADAEKTAEDSDQETDDREIDRADLRVGDRKHHRDHSERPPCSRRIKPVVTHFEHDRLADDQGDGHQRVNVDVSLLEIARANPPGNEGRRRSSRRRGRRRRRSSIRNAVNVFAAFGFIAACTNIFGCRSLCRLLRLMVKTQISLRREAFFLTLHDRFRERRKWLMLQTNIRKT